MADKDFKITEKQKRLIYNYVTDYEGKTGQQVAEKMLRYVKGPKLLQLLKEAIDFEDDMRDHDKE